VAAVRAATDLGGLGAPIYIDHTVTLEVSSYIAHPYWPETEDLVNILKKSGYNRARSDAGRESALREYLKVIGMSAEEFEDLKARAARQWHRSDDGTIIIPRHQFSGALVETLLRMPSRQRPFADAGTLRSLVQISDLRTDRTEADATWRRFVRPTKDGKPLSNQRSERSNEVINAFTATGVLSFDPSEIDSDADKARQKLDDMLAYCGKYIGLGASRKMGHGRFTVATLAAA